MAKQALDGKRLNAFAMNPGDLIIIGLDTKDGPEHPLWDERIWYPIAEEMVLNIMKLGVISPVTVRKNSNGDPEVVDGRQRVRAAREAAIRQSKAGEVQVLVPVVLKRGEDKHVAGLAESANALRTDDSPLVRANKANRLLDLGNTIEDAAAYFGVSMPTIGNWLALLNLSAPVRKAVEDGKLSPTAASKLSKLAKGDQEPAMQKLLTDGKGTVRKVEKLVKAKKSGSELDSMELGNAPSKKLLGWVTELHQEDPDAFQLNDDVITGIRFALGKLSASAIKGMTAAIRHVEEN